jgi:hypothetical protein
LRQETAVCSHLNIDGHPFPVNFRIMKTLLAILLSFIISEAPVLAIHGGYSLGSSQSAVGTYAGVLIPTNDVILSGTTAVSGSTGAVAGGFGTNSLGLFTLSIPDVGLGSGTVLIFSSAQGMTGTIQAVADPTNPGGVIGVIEATGQVATFSASDNFGDNFSFNQVTGNAAGYLQASVNQALFSASPTGVNISGTSVVTFSVATTDSNAVTTFQASEEVTYLVDGFQQSTVATATSGT